MPSEVSIADFWISLGDDPMRLPDGEAVGSSEEDWQAVLGLLSKSSWQSSLIDTDSPIPKSAIELDQNFGIRVMLDAKLRVNMYNWGIVGFDIDLDEIVEQRDVDFIVEFIRRLGQALSKSIMLSPEGYLGQQPVLVYDVASDAMNLQPPAIWEPA